MQQQARDKLDKCLELGADFAVDHRKDDWHKEVRVIAKKIPKPYGDISGVDVIFEHIGGSHWNKELTLLNYGGTIVTTGATTGYDAKTDLRHIFFKGINILGSTQGTRSELGELVSTGCQKAKLNLSLIQCIFFRRCS